MTPNIRMDTPSRIGTRSAIRFRMYRIISRWFLLKDSDWRGPERDDSRKEPPRSVAIAYSMDTPYSGLMRLGYIT